MGSSVLCSLHFINVSFDLLTLFDVLVVFMLQSSLPLGSLQLEVTSNLDLGLLGYLLREVFIDFQFCEAG